MRALEDKVGKLNLNCDEIGKDLDGNIEFTNKLFDTY